MMYGRTFSRRNPLGGLAGFGDFDVPGPIASLGAGVIGQPEVQSYIYDVGGMLVRRALPKFRSQAAEPASTHPDLDRLLKTITTPLAAGAKDAALPWALGIVAGTFFLGYALGRR
jgi:hypothetical protein